MQADESIPDDYQLLAPGCNVAVPCSWLANLLQGTRKKIKHGNKGREETTPGAIIRRLIDGFIEPWQIGKASGTKAMLNDPVIGPILNAIKSKF